MQSYLYSAAARTCFRQKAGQGMSGIGHVGMQLQRLPGMQKNGEIPADPMRFHPEDGNQKGDLGTHVTAEKIDRNLPQGLPELCCGHSLVIHHLPPFRPE